MIGFNPIGRHEINNIGIGNIEFNESSGYLNPKIDSKKSMIYYKGKSIISEFFDKIFVIKFKPKVIEIFHKGKFNIIKFLNKKS